MRLKLQSVPRNWQQVSATGPGSRWRFSNCFSEKIPGSKIGRDPGLVPGFFYILKINDYCLKFEAKIFFSLNFNDF